MYFFREGDGISRTKGFVSYNHRKTCSECKYYQRIGDENPKSCTKLAVPFQCMEDDSCDEYEDYD